MNIRYEDDEDELYKDIYEYYSDIEHSLYPNAIILEMLEKKPVGDI